MERPWSTEGKCEKTYGKLTDDLKKKQKHFGRTMAITGHYGELRESMENLRKNEQILEESCTPEFLSKKHLNFGQGLEFLKFGQGNRDPNQQNRRKTTEKHYKNK